jgi:hypothetical protein
LSLLTPRNETIAIPPDKDIVNLSFDLGDNPIVVGGDS